MSEEYGETRTHYTGTPCGMRGLYRSKETIYANEVTCKSCKKHLGMKLFWDKKSNKMRMEDERSSKARQ